ARWVRHAIAPARHRRGRESRAPRRRRLPADPHRSGHFRPARRHAPAFPPTRPERRQLVRLQRALLRLALLRLALLRLALLRLALLRRALLRRALLRLAPPPLAQRRRARRRRARWRYRLARTHSALRPSRQRRQHDGRRPE